MKLKKNEERLSMGKNKEGVVFPVASPLETMPDYYHSFLSELKQKIKRERVRVITASNAVVVMLYWDIGKSILDKQRKSG